MSEFEKGGSGFDLYDLYKLVWQESSVSKVITGYC